VIEQILPPAVAAADTREELLDVELFPEELSVLGQAVEKRRREFVSGRACARRALAELGEAPVPIVAGERGEPCWPAGIVGSITHCAGYRACAVARVTELAALGIDAEPNTTLPAGVLREIARPAELSMLAGLPREAATHWDRLLFCAKEAIYKVWFPIARCWLGFEDAELTIDATDGTFRARLLVPWPAAGADLPVLLEGRWLMQDGLLLAAIALVAPRDSSI
jgi:4'-phosphopantetheinyl transferase EntD